MRWTVSNRPRVRPSAAVRVGLCCIALVCAFDASASDEPRAAGSVGPPLPTVVHLGEFRHSAHTLPAGTVALHPLFHPSTVGLTNRIDLKAPILGLLDGPAVALEVMVAAGRTRTASIEPWFTTHSEGSEEEFESGWALESVQAGASWMETRAVGDHQLNLGVGFSHWTETDRFSAPLEAGIDLRASARVMTHIGMGTDVLGLASGRKNGGLSLKFSRGVDRFRVSAGMVAMAGTVDDAGRYFAAVGPSTPVRLVRVRLVPQASLWWSLGGPRPASLPKPTRPQWRKSDPKASTATAGKKAIAQARTSVGASVGAGVRVHDSTEIPDGGAPRLDFAVLEFRRALENPYALNWQPARVDVQADLVHGYLSRTYTTSPRLPLTVYATWLVPVAKSLSGALSPGVYTELGWDSFVEEEQLVRRFAGTAGVAMRLGLERHHRMYTGGFYIRGVTGMSMDPDPNELSPTRFTRIGVEHVWSWGRSVGEQGGTP